jgi:hypothetical protein
LCTSRGFCLEGTVTSALCVCPPGIEYSTSAASFCCLLSLLSTSSSS